MNPPIANTMTIFVLLVWFQYLIRPSSSLALSTGRDKTSFIQRRQSGIKLKRNGKRPPRWEQEGDQLYQEIPTDKSISYEEALAKLKELEQIQSPSVTTRQKPKSKEVEAPKKSAPPHMVWGSLPVGPILKKQLDLAGVKEPTPIQEASFSVISKGYNAVIASPTGTGKTLAYLVPLLATKKRSVSCQILIVTPTLELALQIQGEVDRLWSSTEPGDSDVHVVGSAFAKDQESSLFEKDTLEKPILCGTPRRIRDLLQEINNSRSPLARQFFKLWKTNLKTIVLDEADRLLRTEGNARRQQAHKGRPAPTQAQTLLAEMGDLNKYQLICASATVGRTLRRQLMEMTNSPSIDKASTVITADTRASGKDVHKRRAALLPDTIKHSCVLLPESKDETLNTLSSIMASMTPSKTIVFPGRFGVQQVQEHLKEVMKLENVLSIDDINRNNAESDAATWNKSPVYVVPDKFARGLDIEGVQQVFLLSTPSSAAGYMHLVGRTGRNGRSGHAITMVHSTEVHRLAVIAERLGVSFCPTEAEYRTGTTMEAEGKSTKSTEFQAPPETTADLPATNTWSDLSNSQLMRKTVAELKSYIEDNGISIPNDDGGKILKADLVAAIQSADQT